MSRKRFWSCVGASLLCSLLSASAELVPAIDLPEGGRDLLAPGKLPLGHPVVPKEPGIATAEARRDPDGAFPDLWRFNITAAPKSPWSVQLGAELASPIAKGDKCLLLFYARAVSGKAAGTANVELRVPPNYPKLGQDGFTVGTQWEPVLLPFTASDAGPPGKCGVAIHVGGAVQQIELSGLRLLDFGPAFPFEKLPHPLVSYEGREADAPWRKAALERIEKTRKSKNSSPPA